jgi:hypothetical protein
MQRVRIFSVEKFKYLSGKEKNNIVYDNITILLYRKYRIEEANRYIVLINLYTENLIVSSKSKIRLNRKKNFFKCYF